MAEELHVRISYLLLVDGYIVHPEGELTIAKDDWEKHKVYHAALGGHFIDCNATGGEPDIAKEMLTSKGIQFREFR